MALHFRSKRVLRPLRTASQLAATWIAVAIDMYEKFRFRMERNSTSPVLEVLIKVLSRCSKLRLFG